MSKLFSIQLQNRQQSRDGVWLDLPTTTEQVQAALRQIDISSDNPQGLFISGYFAEEEKPVSYTHLDVYKRQPSPSFQAASRANRSPPQGDSAASTMNATSGPKCCALSGNCSPVGCLEKMLLASSVWGSTKRSLTWSRQVTMFGFSYYLLLPLARGTNGNGYSSSVPLLPTPLASDTGDVGKGLDIQISANGSYRKMNKDGKAWTARLSHVVYRMTPTTLEKPYLNPDWVEWLMGFPRKWTDIPFGPKNPPTSRV